MTSFRQRNHELYFIILVLHVSGFLQKLAWDAQEPQERKLNFLPAKFKNLRSVPAYARFVQERFERCLDLYLCPRQRKLRVSSNSPFAC